MAHLDPQRRFLPDHEDLLLSDPVPLRRILDVKLQNQARNYRLDLRIRKVAPDAAPRAKLEGLRSTALVPRELRVLARPALRGKLLGARPVRRAVGGGVDGDAHGHALGEEVAVDGRSAGGHDAVVRLRGGGVDAKALFDAGEEVLAGVQPRECDFVGAAEGFADLLGKLL